jgi:hypothetical protein
MRSWTGWGRRSAQRDTRHPRRDIGFEAGQLLASPCCRRASGLFIYLDPLGFVSPVPLGSTVFGDKCPGLGEPTIPRTGAVELSVPMSPGNSVGSVVDDAVPSAVLLRGKGGYTALTAGGYTVVAVPNPTVVGACCEPTVYPTNPPTPSNTAPSNIPVMVFLSMSAETRRGTVTFHPPQDAEHAPGHHQNPYGFRNDVRLSGVM